MALAQLTKIHDPQLSRNGNYSYTRIDLKLADGSFAQTDLVKSYRNYKYWRPVIKAGVGTWIDNLSLISPNKANADSKVKIYIDKLPFSDLPMSDKDEISHALGL
jgi:hypothetical protein